MYASVITQLTYIYIYIRIFVVYIYMRMKLITRKKKTAWRAKKMKKENVGALFSRT